MADFIHHIDLTVTDPAKSAPVYDVFLRHAGFEPKSSGEGWAAWGLAGKRYPSIAILEGAGENKFRRHDRYSPGLHHFALRAKSRADVDELHQKLIAVGAFILDAPADYPDYGAGYYAVFFADADGLKLEYAYSEV